MDISILVYVIVFAVVVYFIYRFMKLIFKAIMVFVAGAIFPFFANYFLNAGIPITMENIIFYSFGALALFFAVMLVKNIITVLKVITWPFRKLFGKSEKESIKEELEEEMKKKSR